MKKIIITTAIVLSAAIVVTSGIQTSKQKQVKTNTLSITNSTHSGNQLASAD